MLKFDYGLGLLLLILATLALIPPMEGFSARLLMKRGLGVSGVKLRLSSSEILSIVDATDFGTTGLSAEQKAKVDGWLEKKMIEGKNSPVIGKGKDRLLGNYFVSYVSAGKSQRGNPAGGNFRGRIGRVLFKTTGLYQHLLDEGESETGEIQVVNLVVGRLLSILELNVVLSGFARILSSNEQKQMGLGVNAVEAKFEAPRIMLRFGSALAALLSRVPGMTLSSSLSAQLNRLNLLLQVGPPSSVVLDTPYVDESLRIGVGGRGSQFVFKRIKDSTPDFTKSEIWRQLLSRKPVDARSASIFLSFLGAYCGFVGRRVAGFALSLGAVTLAYWKGGKFR